MLPYIEAKGARELTATAQDRVKFDVAIFGEPAPEVTWLKGEEPVDQEMDTASKKINGLIKM